MEIRLLAPVEIVSPETDSPMCIKSIVVVDFQFSGQESEIPSSERNIFAGNVRPTYIELFNLG